MRLSTARTLHSLAFVLSHREDVFSLAGEEGAARPRHVSASDWKKLQDVLGHASAQVEAILDGILEACAPRIGSTGARFKRVTRSSTARHRWEAHGDIFLPRAREPFAVFGANLAFPTPLSSGLNVFFAYKLHRNARGPQLRDVLWRRGVEVQLATGRDLYEGWFRGTLLLGGMDVKASTAIEECISLASTLLDRTLIAHWDWVVPAR
jgi:hypothetical protein